MQKPTEGEEPDDNVHQLPVIAKAYGSNATTPESHDGRELADRVCGIFFDGNYFHPQSGFCYDLGGTSWNDKVTWVRSGSVNTNIQVWDHSGPNGGFGNSWVVYGGAWTQLDAVLYKKVAYVCCE